MKTTAAKVMQAKRLLRVANDGWLSAAIGNPFWSELDADQHSGLAVKHHNRMLAIERQEISDWLEDIVDLSLDID